MGFRTVVIKSRCKLEYSLNFLVYRNEKENKRICLDEINSLIIQSTEVAITTALLSSLIEKKIQIIFCDSFSNPQSELLPLYGAYNTHEKLIKQFNVSQETADKTWQIIVRKKILNQSENLKYKNLDTYKMLEDYANDVLPSDPSNREGFAAKVYFNSLFGKDFSRDNEKREENAFLNYGYSIILSAINRKIKSLGYLTELGIHHIGYSNPFNLSCDIMEPLRPMIDYCVISNKVNKDNFKDYFIGLLDIIVNYEEQRMFLENAIDAYVQSVIASIMTEDISKISFVEYGKF